MISEERLKSHYESLARAIRFVRAADTKAAPALGLQIALVGTLAARSEKLWTIVGKFPWETEGTILAALLILYVSFVIAVVVLAALVYMPTNPRTGKSLIYFEDISHMEYEAFEAQAKEMTPDLIEHQLLDQIHRVSQISSTKMRRVRWAFILTGPSSLLWLVLMVWGSVNS